MLTSLRAAFGALIGSFLNVCIYRLPLGESIVWPASRCPRCGRALAWYENIPVVSYAGAARPLPHVPGADLGALSDRRGADGARCSPAAWWYYGPAPLLASRLMFGCALIVLFAIDLEHHLLPNVITLPGIVVGFVFSFVHRARLACRR